MSLVGARAVKLFTKVWASGMSTVYAKSSSLTKTRYVRASGGGTKGLFGLAAELT